MGECNDWQCKWHFPWQNVWFNLFSGKRHASCLCQVSQCFVIVVIIQTHLAQDAKKSGKYECEECRARLPWDALSQPESGGVWERVGSILPCAYIPQLFLTTAPRLLQCFPLGPLRKHVWLLFLLTRGQIQTESENDSIEALKPPSLRGKKWLG